MAVPGILCIGAVHWDVIGRASAPLARGDDRPGGVLRQPGGVAFNIAGHLARAGLRPALLSAVGRDAAGRALAAAAAAAGIDTALLTRVEAATGIYLGIEDPDGLVAAIADTAALEAAGDRVLAPLQDGRLPVPWPGAAVVDGNLGAGLIARLAAAPALAGADLRAVAASNAKAAALAPLLARAGATLYLNRAEAEGLAGAPLADAATAARGLAGMGRARILVTDGAAPAALAEGARLVCHSPPPVAAARVTGAGDRFCAAHLAAELAGVPPEAALATALQAAADHVSGKEPA